MVFPYKQIPHTLTTPTDPIQGPYSQLHSYIMRDCKQSLGTEPAGTRGGGARVLQVWKGGQERTPASDRDKEAAADSISWEQAGRGEGDEEWVENRCLS